MLFVATFYLEAMLSTPSPIDPLCIIDPSAHLYGCFKVLSAVPAYGGADKCVQDFNDLHLHKYLFLAVLIFRNC